MIILLLSEGITSCIGTIGIIDHGIGISTVALIINRQWLHFGCCSSIIFGVSGFDTILVASVISTSIALHFHRFVNLEQFKS